VTAEEIPLWYEKEFKKISNEIRDKDFLTLTDILRIRNLGQQSSTTQKEEEIKRITGEAFKQALKDWKAKAIETLTEIKGVKIPTAILILSLRFPDSFQIINYGTITEMFRKGIIREEVYDKWTQTLNKDIKTYMKILEYLMKNKKAEELIAR